MLLSSLAICFILLQSTLAFSSPIYCPNGTVVAMGNDRDGCQRPPVCMKPNQCPTFGPQRCRSGETLVNMGRNEVGCQNPPVCVELNSCPTFHPPYCPNGKIVSTGRLDTGCLAPSVCVEKNQCPVF